MRFGGNALRHLLDGLSDENRDGMRAALDDYNEHASTSSMTIELKKFETCPQLELLQYAADKSLDNGIYLFVSEAVKLVQHMNTVFAFSKSKCLLSVETKPITPIKPNTDDHFF